MTMSELFEKLPEVFNSKAAGDMSKVFQWNITGDEAGVWAFQIVHGVGQLIPGGIEQPDITITVSDKNWLAIAEGKQDSLRAFMTGKLKVKGDMALAMRIPQLFPTKSQS